MKAQKLTVPWTLCWNSIVLNQIKFLQDFAYFISEHDEASQTYDIFLSLEDALSPRTIDTVIDDGMIPGDRRGAGGLDSSMFV